MVAPVRVAINGFGRIGRLVMRAWLESNHQGTFEIVALNDLASPETNAHLLNYDSVHGRLPTHTTAAKDGGGDILQVGERHIRMLRIANPAELPWADLKIDLVLECSGRFTKRAEAEQHLKAGAKRVLVSAPATDDDVTIVYGVNQGELKPEYTIVSNASCTTNCLAPLAMVLDAAIGIERGFMTTIHSYTGDQRLVDTAHEDLHRARAAAQSMIPTSTGAAKAVGKVLPQLKGKLDGTAIRVPTANVSAVDFKFDAGRATTVDEVNNALEAAAKGALKGILATSLEPLVSVDLNHVAVSSTAMLPETKVVDGRFVRVFAWYDNEWGFSNRMIDTAALMARQLSGQLKA